MEQCERAAFLFAKQMKLKTEKCENSLDELVDNFCSSFYHYQIFYTILVCDIVMNNIPFLSFFAFFCNYEIYERYVYPRFLLSLKRKLRACIPE